MVIVASWKKRYQIGISLPLKGHLGEDDFTKCPSRGFLIKVHTLIPPSCDVSFLQRLFQCVEAQQFLLQPRDLSFQLSRIELRILPFQDFLVVVRHVRRCQDPPVRSRRSIILLDDLAADPCFLKQFHRGLEEVGVEAQVPVKLIEGEKFFFRVISEISYSSSYNRVILLLNKTVIVFPVTPGPGEGDPLLSAVPQD